MNACTRLPARAAAPTRIARALALACALPVLAHAQAHDPASHAGHTMDHGAMSQDEAMPTASPADAQAPITPIPPVTDADRAAAAPPAHGHDHGRKVFTFLMVDRLEGWNDGGGGQAWNVKGWIGSDMHKLWLRTEGEREAGRLADADVELLYGRPIARWWDMLAGVRTTFGPGPSRTAAAFGVRGTAPQKIEVEATAWLDGDGRLSARAEGEYSLLLTNRWILQPRLEAEWQAREDRARGLGAGLSTLAGGLRLRYEIDRRFAPYVGVERVRHFGGTADLLRADGEATGETRVVAGLRLRF